MIKHPPVALVILDGFGYSQEAEHNAIAQASTPFITSLMDQYPTTLLNASGQAVGLPDGYIGNSEVGHLTLGCGMAILQPVTLINDAVETGEFFENKMLIKRLKKLKKVDKTLHIIGLLSDAGVHGHIDHLLAFLFTAHQSGIKKIVIHAILDGRDVPPQSAHDYLSGVEEHLKEYGAVLGSIQGRFYAMDRNQNNNLTQESFTMMTSPQVVQEKKWQEVLENYYQKGITDEFIPPTLLKNGMNIQEGDGLIITNFRADRMRQLVGLLQSFSLSFIVTPVSYGKEYHTDVLFERLVIPQTLSEFLHQHGCSLFFIAETEKYAHITYFFNGGREKKFDNETRVLIPSLLPNQFATHPSMSAPSITQAVRESLQYNAKDFYVINYANADMVGHTGNFKATVKAIECLDQQLKILYQEFVEKRNGTLFITADHGKAESMYDPDAMQPRTAHTINPVPFIIVNKELKNKLYDLPLYELADVAPFIIHSMFEN